METLLIYSDTNSEVLRLETNSKDIVVKNTPGTTTWYKINYSKTVQEFPELSNVKQILRIKLIFIITIIFTVFPLIGLKDIDITQHSFFGLILHSIISIIVLTVYLWFFIFVVYGKSPYTFWLEYVNRYYREFFKKGNMEGYSICLDHLFTISIDGDTSISDNLYNAKDFLGFRVRRSRTQKFGLILGYGLVLLLSQERTIQIIENKGIDERDKIYFALEKSLETIARNVNSTHKFRGSNIIGYAGPMS